MNQAEWYTLYSDALVERDPIKLGSRITEAETAMFLRIQDLVQASDSNSEREIIANALANLHALRRNIMPYSNTQIA